MDESRETMTHRDDIEAHHSSTRSKLEIASRNAHSSLAPGGMHHLADGTDILELIMSHLPALSLLQCRQISRLWNETVRRPSTLGLWAQHNAPIDTWVPFRLNDGPTSSLLLYNGRTKEWMAEVQDRIPLPDNPFCRLSQASSHGLLIFTLLMTGRTPDSNESSTAPRIMVRNPITHARRMLPPLPNAERVIDIICGPKIIHFDDPNYGSSAHYKVLAAVKYADLEQHSAPRRTHAYGRRLESQLKLAVTSYVFYTRTGKWQEAVVPPILTSPNVVVTEICQLVGKKPFPEQNSREHVPFDYLCVNGASVRSGSRIDKGVSLLSFDHEQEAWIEELVPDCTLFRHRITQHSFYRLPGGFIQRKADVLAVATEVDSNCLCVGVAILSFTIQPGKCSEHQHWSILSKMPLHIFTKLHRTNANLPCKYESGVEFQGSNCLKHVVYMADDSVDQIVFLDYFAWVLASYRFSGTPHGEWVGLMPPLQGSPSAHEHPSLPGTSNRRALLGMNFGLQLRPDISP